MTNAVRPGKCPIDTAQVARSRLILLVSIIMLSGGVCLMLNLPVWGGVFLGAATALAVTAAVVHSSVPPIIERLREIENSLGQFRTVFECAGEALLLVDHRGTICRSNGAADSVFGYEPMELQGLNVRELVQSPHAERHDEYLERYGETGVSRVVGHRRRVVARRKDGGGVPIELHVQRTAGEGPPMYAVLAYDLTEFEKVERERERHSSGLDAANAELERALAAASDASRAKSAFFANMSHEIRTPLTAIKGFCDILCDDYSTDDERNEASRVIGSSADHLLALVNDILDYSRLEADAVQIESVAFDPSRIAEDVRGLLSGLASQKGIALLLRATDLPPALVGDPTRIRQVLLNLVGNAIKFTDEGAVELSLDMSAGGLRVRVDDDGIGVHADKLEQVFSPFAQEDASTSRKFGGTGLGLSISKALVEKMGGSLVATSAVGVGSTFEFVLPLRTCLESEIAVADRESESGTEPRCLSGTRVLVVDDSPDNRRLVAVFASRLGAEVLEASNGKEGVRAVVEAMESGNDIDLVLMDLQMPVLDGWGATKRIRSLGVDCPIVAFTANAPELSWAECEAAGFDSLCSKPIERGDFCRILRDHMRSRSAVD